MKDIILIVTEGKHPEFDMIEQMKEFFFPDSKRTIVKAYWHSNLIDLCKTIKDDPFLDYVGLLKDEDGNEELRDISSDSISEVYLLFDYDVHGAKTRAGGKDRYDKDLIELLRELDNETSPLGKLFISYPMVESLWDVPMQCENLSSCFLGLEDLKYYKKRIKGLSPNMEEPLEGDSCLHLLAEHSTRALVLSYGDEVTFSLGSLLAIESDRIHEKQVDVFWKRNKVFALSPIPLFLLSVDKRIFSLLCPFFLNGQGCGCRCLS